MNAAAADKAVAWHDDKHGSFWTPLRWGLCFAAILTLHAAGTWIVLHWPRVEEPPSSPPPAAVMIELAPLPTAPPAPPSEIPTGPKQIVSEPPPPEPVVQPLPPTPPSPAPEVEVPLPPKPPPKPPKPHRRIVVHQPPRPRPDNNEPPALATTAPPQVQAPPAPAVAAPTRGVAAARSSNALPTWQGLLLARLEQFKRYPSAAQLHRQQGVAYLRFTVDRRGKVLSAHIDKSSGVAALDAETLALVHRAEPLPPPPPEVPSNPIELVVPVEFSLN